MLDLNLLPNQAKFQLRKMRLKKKINFICVVVGIIWLAIIIGVFMTRFVVDLKLSNSTKNNTKALNQFKTVSSVIMLNQQMKFRAKQVGKILNERYEYGKVLTRANNLFANDTVSINSYKMESKKEFTFVGSAIGYENMNKLEKKINSINRGEIEGFSGALINSLAVDKGAWTFDITVYLN